MPGPTLPGVFEIQEQDEMKIWGCKVGYGFDGSDPKEKSCSIHFGFVLLQLVLIPKFLHVCVCKKAASLFSLTRAVQLSRISKLVRTDT